MKRILASRPVLGSALVAALAIALPAGGGRTGRAGLRGRIEWSNTVCGACPLSAQCVSAGQDHRTFVVGELHSLLQERRREMQTDAFRHDMRKRNGIEGTQSELVRG